MPLLRLFSVLGIACTAIFAAPREHRFDFGSIQPVAGYLPVTADMAYTAARGYGFEPGAKITDCHHSGDALRRDFCTGERPFFFSVDLPEGNYRVTLLLGDPMGESHTVVKAESRRLVLPPVDTKIGELVTASFLVHLRNARLPDGSQVRLKPREIGALHWDNRLTVEFNGTRPCIAAMEITPAAEAITIFLAGDSTVTDQQVEPWAAWGQMLPAFFDPTVVIANHAESGETIKSFVGEQRLAKILALIKAGDYLLIQFGHNDQKAGPEHSGAMTEFKDYLRKYIAQARAVGAQPVLVTAMERRNFDLAGHIVPTLEDYPQAMREVGSELAAPVIDLNAMSIALYEALGPDEARKAFVHFPARSFPGQNQALADDTHFSSYGADQLARCVVEGVQARLPELARHLRAGLPSYSPARPGRFADWHLPASPPKPTVKPEGS